MSRRNVGIVIGAVVGVWVLINVLTATGLPHWATGIIVDSAIFLTIGLYVRRFGQRYTPSVVVVIGVPIAAVLIALFLPHPADFGVEAAGFAWYVIGATYLNKIRPRRQAAKPPAAPN
jgi:carbon starvation protein CstA